jgi:hypothetical protein
VDHLPKLDVAANGVNRHSAVTPGPPPNPHIELDSTTQRMEACPQFWGDLTMGMLARAEAAYLDILRVVVLAVATLAMIVAFAGLGIGIWMYVTNNGTHRHAPPVEAITLGDYISEQRAALAPQGGPVPDSTGEQSQIVVVREAIRPAYNDFVQYITSRMGATVNKTGFAGDLNSDYDGFDDTYRAAYAISLNSLARQISISKGRPLSIEQFSNLISWHQKKFQDATAVDKIAKAGREQLGQQLVGLGAASFLAFLLLVFCFIFVKIERNLRTVKTMTTVVEG